MIVMAKVTFNNYMDALQYARDIDERVVNSLSTPDELRATVVNYYKAQANQLGRAIDEAEFYAEHLKVRVVYQDAKPVAGYLVLGGELLGLFSLVRGKGDWIMQHAVDDGAARLDCFAEPALLKLYHKHGFKIKNSVANFDPKGLPVVYMYR